MNTFPLSELFAPSNVSIVVETGVLDWCPHRGLVLRPLEDNDVPEPVDPVLVDLGIVSFFIAVDMSIVVVFVLRSINGSSHKIK